MVEINLSELVDKKIELEKEIKRVEEIFLAKVEELCRAFEGETGVCLERPVYSELFLRAMSVEIDFDKTQEKIKHEEG